MSAACLDRSPPHNLGRSCPFHYRARAPNGEANEMTTMSNEHDDTNKPAAENSATAVQAVNPVQSQPAEKPVSQAVAKAAPLKQKVIVRDLKFYYGESLALNNISLPLYAHRATAFIGPSGCGKSTLLRVLNRMYDL